MIHNKDIFDQMSSLNHSNSLIDMHIHTTWTDGKNTLSEMIEKSAKNGLKKICITDHIRKESDYYLKYIEAVRQNRCYQKMKIYCGFEAKILNISGEIDIPKSASEKADIVIASVHRIPVDNEYVQPKELTFKELADIELGLALAAISNKCMNVIGHSGGMSISVYGEFPESYFEKIILECKNNDIAFEYNYKYHFKYEDVLKKLLYKYDTYVSIGSDAHSIDEIANRGFCCA